MTKDRRGSRRVLVAIAEPERSAFLPPALWARLSEICDTVVATPAELQDQLRYAEVMADVDVAVTSWGFPAFDSARLASAPRLRLIVHTGASVRFLMTDELWRSGIPVVQAGDAMAPAVAELSLAFTLALLRRLPRLDHGLHDLAPWDTIRLAPRGREIRHARIGVIGASRTGRHYIEVCRALGARIAIYDPYLGGGDELAALASPLDEVLSTGDVIAIHAPLTDLSRGMIGRREIALMRDGTLVINTARAALVDMDALYEAASAGRIDVALDVFDIEPLPTDDRWRVLPNALLTPHLGGATAESRERAGEIVIDEIERHLRSAAPARKIDTDRWEIVG